MYIVAPLPTPWLDRLPDKADLFLAESSLMLNSEPYFSCYSSMRKPVLLNWSEGVSFTGLCDLADQMHRPIITIPYVADDGEATISAYKEYYTYYRKRYRGVCTFMAPRLMTVVQGKSWDDFWKCYQCLAGPWIDLVAIPTNIGFDSPDGKGGTPSGSPFFVSVMRRMRLLAHLSQMHELGIMRQRVRLHLLDVLHPMELIGVNRYCFSLSTYLPLSAAYHGKSLYKGDENYAEVEGPQVTPISLEEVGKEEELSESKFDLFKENLSAMFATVKNKQVAERSTTNG